MDKTDLEILKILQKKARIPNVEVARTIGMAPSAILERIKKLEARGVIQGYEVRLNPDMFHCTMTAFVQIQVTSPSAVADAGKALARIEKGSGSSLPGRRGCPHGQTKNIGKHRA